MGPPWLSEYAHATLHGDHDTDGTFCDFYTEVSSRSYLHFRRNEGVNVKLTIFFIAL
jgi:hypothetical protein